MTVSSVFFSKFAQLPAVLEFLYKNLSDGKDKYMKWYNRLYLGSGLQGKKEKLIRKLECNAGLPGICLLTLASNGKDLFDILPSHLLKQKALRRNLPPIIGIAVGYEEAVGLVTGIVEETIRETGGTDVRQYLKDKLKKEGQ